MSTTSAPDRFAALPDEQTLAATVTALEMHVVLIRQVAGF